MQLDVKNSETYLLTAGLVIVVRTHMTMVVVFGRWERISTILLPGGKPAAADESPSLIDSVDHKV